MSAEGKQILSCIQPTGNLHFGRYFGAVQNWVRLQSEYDCLYGVVDYHAMTMPFNPARMRQTTWDVVFFLLACGIRPSNLFVQSLIPEHAELAWILSCTSSYGELTRMTQFKDKSQQVRDDGKDSFISAGLFTYPVLQAADIIIYHANYVPVGKDQEQHLELTRNIAQRFNHLVKKEYFPIPEPLFTPVQKVMSTADPTRKMSASLGEKHNIDVFADPDRIRKQIRSAVTDSGVSTNGEMSPGVENLFSLLRASSDEGLYNEQLDLYQRGDLQYGSFKEVVAESLVKTSDPIRLRLAELKERKREVKREVKASSAEIRKRAIQTLREVKDLIGLQNP